jgi:hypothetical protein
MINTQIRIFKITVNSTRGTFAKRTFTKIYLAQITVNSTRGTVAKRTFTKIYLAQIVGLYLQDETISLCRFSEVLSPQKESGSTNNKPANHIKGECWSANHKSTNCHIFTRSASNIYQSAHCGFATCETYFADRPSLENRSISQ